MVKILEEAVHFGEVMQKILIVPDELPMSWLNSWTLPIEK